MAICDVCMGRQAAPDYQAWVCETCGQHYEYDECHRLKLSDRQCDILRILAGQPPLLMSTDEGIGHALALALRLEADAIDCPVEQIAQRIVSLPPFPQGQLARFLGAGSNANPYAGQRLAFEQWFAGWQEEFVFVTQARDEQTWGT